MLHNTVIKVVLNGRDRREVDSCFIALTKRQILTGQTGQKKTW